jgi:hypothetical protein
MVLLPNNQDLTAASGLINIGYMENIYHTFMDEAMVDLGENRQVLFHLQPSIEQDTTTQSQIQSANYNPFFGGVPAPRSNTRNKGVKVTPRDVQYNAQVVIGPRDSDDTEGIGELKENQIQLTVVIEALHHVQSALSFSVEGRRYKIDDNRPIGFTKRRYLMVFGTEINEQETPSPDITVG